MEYIIVPDTAIVTVGHNSNADSIIYRDNTGKLHSINFKTCAANFHTEHRNSSGRCIGERNIEESYFLFYTSGTKTQIIFKKAFVIHLFQPNSLKGTRAARFHNLQKFIRKAGYTTFDLS